MDGNKQIQYEPIYERIRNHPQMTYHGFAPNEIVKEHLLQAHIHAYPSIWLECNSRSVIEAMSSGLLCVHPNYGGLTDTSGGMNFMYQGDQDLNKHASIFYHALDHAIKRVSTDDVQQHLRLTKLYADSRYSWDRITSIWTDLLLNLKDRYPTIESRKVQDKFYYET